MLRYDYKAQTIVCNPIIEKNLDRFNRIEEAIFVGLVLSGRGPGSAAEAAYDAAAEICPAGCGLRERIFAAQQ